MSEIYVRGTMPDNSLTSPQRAAIWDIAEEQAATHASINMQLGTICASGRSGRNYTYLDELVGLLQARGMHDYYIKTVYSATGGDWNCTDENTLANFSAGDQTALVDAAVDTLEHLETLGVDLGRCVVGLWNEWTRSEYGGVTPTTVGSGTATQKSLFNAMATGLRAAYPSLKMGTPIFSVLDSATYTWSDIVSGNVLTGGQLESFMTLPDYIVGNFYQGVSSEIPVRGVGAIRRVTRRMYDSFVLALSRVDVGGVLASKPIIFLETGLTYISSGQRLSTSNVKYFHGGSKHHADCVMAQITQLQQYERVFRIGRYQLNNRSDALDSIDHAGNYGDTLWNGGTILRTSLHTAMARHNGATEESIEAIEVAPAGSGGLTTPS